MRLNPLFTEWLMGWPIGWTDFAPVETAWCHWWRHMHFELFTLLIEIMNNLKIEYRPLDELIPYANNARTHSDEQIAEIAASIAEFGFVNPVLVDEDGVLHCRTWTFVGGAKLGMKQVPTIQLAHLSEAQRKALIIADNRIALNAGWDEDLLKLELEALQIG